MIETTEKIQQAVGQMYSAHPFPKRNAYGVEKMNRDFIQNLQTLGLSPEFLKGRRVLDAGCGTGELACFMASLGADVTGIDISEGSLAYAREIAQAQGRAVRFIQGSLLDHPFEPDSFDVVVSHMVLHHTPDPARGFANIARALAPGGTLMVRVFCRWGRLSPFQKSPLWKVKIVQWIAGPDPDRRVRLAEKLFYRSGDEVAHGLDRRTYLYDNFGVPCVSHHTFGEMLKWFHSAGIAYQRANPPMELSRFLAPYLVPKISATWRGRLSRLLARIIFGVLPIHRLRMFKRPTWISRGVTQFFHLFLSGVTMVTVMGVKVGAAKKEGTVSAGDGPNRGAPPRADAIEHGGVLFGPAGPADTLRGIWLQTVYTLRCLSLVPVTLIKHVILGRDPYWRQFFFNKWGYLSASLRHRITGRPVIWLDCLGGGEATQIVSLVRRLKRAYPSFAIAASTNNPGPFRFLSRLEGIDGVFDTPWDIGSAVARVVRTLRPKILVVVDQVRFPILLKRTRRMGVPVAVVSAALADGYADGPYMARASALRFWDAVNRIGVTEARDFQNYVALGMPPHRLSLTGNMKFDLEYLRVSDLERRQWRQTLRLSDTDWVWVAGSVHGAEAEEVLSAFVIAREKIPALKLILAPRYEEQIPQITACLQSKGIEFVKRTEAGDGKTLNAPVILLDTFGELPRIYSVAHAIFIGNSLVARDHFGLGQNLVEPLVHGVPVFFGPHMNKWRRFTERLKRAWEGLEIRSGSELAQGLIRVAGDAALSQKITGEITAIVAENASAVERTAALIEGMVGDA